MRLRLSVSVVTGLMLVQALPPALAQSGSKDLVEYALKCKDLYDDLDKANQVLDYVAGALKDIKGKKEPRKPEPFEFKNADARIDKIRRAVNDLKVPPPIDPGASPYKTDELKDNDKAAWRKAAGKVIAYNRALREQVAGLEKCEKQLEALHELAKVEHKAASRMADQFGDLHDNPKVVAVFKEVFGYAYVDLEGKILPALAELRSEAASKARDFRDAREKRERLLRNHTSLLKAGFSAAGLSVPSDISD